MFCCVRGYGGRRAWRTMVSPTILTPLQFRPMHAWLVLCWPACVWSVYGHNVAAAAVSLVHGSRSNLMTGSFAVLSLALQRALARSDVVVGMSVSELVGNFLVPLGRHGTFQLCAAPPTAGEKFSDSWYDRSEKLPNSVRHALLRPESSVARTTNHVVSRSALRASSQLRLCYSYVHPRRWQGPFGHPWCIPVLSMGAPGCCSSSVVRCSRSCLAACRVPYRAVSCG